MVPVITVVRTISVSIISTVSCNLQRLLRQFSSGGLMRKVRQLAAVIISMWAGVLGLALSVVETASGKFSEVFSF